MPDTPDPDEKFSLHPLEGEEVLRRLLGVREGEEVTEEPEDEEADS